MLLSQRSCRHGTAAKRDNMAQEKFTITPGRKKWMRGKREPRTPWPRWTHRGLMHLEMSPLHPNIWQQKQRKSPIWSPKAQHWSLKTLRRSSLEHQGMNGPLQIPVGFSLCSQGCHLVAHPNMAPPLTEGALPQMWAGLVRRDANRAWNYHQRLLMFS